MTNAVVDGIKVQVVIDTGSDTSIGNRALQREMVERTRLEEQVRQAHRLEAVGRLAGGIAHDFNNVLTAIIGFSDLLLANHRPTDPAFRDIVAIKQNANRAATGGLEPDLTLVLDLPPELGFDRIRQAGQGFDRIERAGPEFHDRVAAVFRNATGPGISHLDAALPKEQLLHTAWDLVQARGLAAHPAPRG